MIAVGDTAPDFFLASNTGAPVRLSDYRGRKVVVLYFYPKDDTPGCTVEACGFRDSYEEFVKADAEVIGVSSDDFDRHRAFAEKFGLPFLLLSDPGSKVRERFGVKPTAFVLPGRETFVIDKQGIVRHRFASQLRIGKHIDEALAVVKKLAAAEPGDSKRVSGTGSLYGADRARQRSPCLPSANKVKKQIPSLFSPLVPSPIPAPTARAR